MQISPISKAWLVDRRPKRRENVAHNALILIMHSSWYTER